MRPVKRPPHNQRGSRVCCAGGAHARARKRVPPRRPVHSQRGSRVCCAGGADARVRKHVPARVARVLCRRRRWRRRCTRRAPGSGRRWRQLSPRTRVRSPAEIARGARPYPGTATNALPDEPRARRCAGQCSPPGHPRRRDPPTVPPTARGAKYSSAFENPVNPPFVWFSFFF